MDAIKYIDCFSSIGKWAGKDVDAPWTTEKMLEDMQRCGIHGALVYSNLARDLQPSVGNKIVIDTCNKYPRLIPCWIGLPHHCHDFPDGKTFVREMIDNGVKAVKLFPKLHWYSVNDFQTDDLLQALQEAEIPVIFDRGETDPMTQQITWDEVAYVCSKYPKLHVILHSVRWEATRRLISYARKFPRLYFEFSSYQANRIIEFHVKEIGSDQLLFGTEMKKKSPGAAKAFIDYADIDHQDRRKIAGENLIRLLKLETIPADYPVKQMNDRILQKVHNAEPIDDMKVIDAHAHQMPKGQFDNVVAFMPESDTGGIVERNRRIGVDITCISPWIGIWSDYESGNEVTRESIAEFPDNIIGYATLDPRYVQDWNKELKKCYEIYGMRGLKPYFPKSKIPYNDPLYDEWYTYGDKHRLFALMHFSDNFIPEMEDLAQRYPNISFLLAHSGISYEMAKDFIGLAKRFDNIFLEITYTSVTNGIIEYMVKEAGSSKVIYGSDTAMRDPFPQFGWVTYADIDENDKRNILGYNMAKIIDRCLIK